MIGYIKYKHYIITIELKNINNDKLPKTYYDISNYKENNNIYNKFSHNEYKVINIKDILNNIYNEIDNYKINAEYNNIEFFYLLENLAFYDSFIEKKQYKLFVNGYCGEHKTYINGNLIEEYYHNNGLIEGPYFKYFNGITSSQLNISEFIEIKCDYINGKINGKYIEYYFNNNHHNYNDNNNEINNNCKISKIKFDYSFLNGVKHGMCIEYNYNNDIVTKIEYDNGNFNGYYYEVDEYNKEIIECMYKNNVLDGIYKLYDFNKKPILECKYNLGKMIEYIEYDVLGSQKNTYKG